MYQEATGQSICNALRNEQNIEGANMCIVWRIFKDVKPSVGPLKQESQIES